MIGYIRGELIEIYADKIVIDVGGIGYRVFCNEKEKAELPQVGSEVKMFIHSITKEDGTTLFGFLHKNRKQAFMELIKISGVSGKIATTIMSHCTVEDLRYAIAMKEEAPLTAISGIGKKLANRIINECKIENLLQAADTGQKEGKPEARTKGTNHIEAVSGLVNMGIKQDLAKEIVSKVMEENPEVQLEDIIRLSLARMYEK